VGLGLGALLMPRMGILGASLAFLASALTQTATAFYFARRAYPIPYETGRLLRVLAAGVAASVAGLWLVPDVGPVAGLILRPLVALAVFAGLLVSVGFLRRTERAFAAETLRALRRRRAPADR
jgi:O-antigen/teichoic acid export membrane protein